MVLLACGLHVHIIGVRTGDVVPRCHVSQLESATPSLDDSESDEVWPPALLELPVATPSSESMITLGWTKRIGWQVLVFPLFNKARSCLRCHFGHVCLIALDRAVLTFNPQFPGSWGMDPLFVMTIQVSSWRSSPALSWEGPWQWTQEMGTTQGEYPSKGMSWQQRY